MKKGIEKMDKKEAQILFYKTNPRGGISLIVLVITIIVVIILAAAVIISLQNNNPMLEANEARIKSDVANMQSIFTNTVGKIMAEKQDVVEIDKAQLNTITSGKKAVGIAKYRIKGADGSISVEGEIKFDTGAKSGTTYYTGRQLPLYNKETKWYVDDQGLVSVNIGGTKYGEGDQEGKVTVGEKVTGSVKEYTDADGDVAMIPIDFAIVPGKTDISNGLVISDVANDVSDIGNQFVWVPVDNIDNFVIGNRYSNGNLMDNSLYAEPLERNGVVIETEEEVNEYEKMISSIITYHGFYVGRYEISNDGNDNAQSKKNKDPWVNIKWGNSLTDLNGGMAEKARTMYPENLAKKGGVVSTLIYGVAWDETVRFISKNYPGIEKDSTGYGNYTLSKTIQTGSEEKYSLNNIYDMAGNVYEWTMEGIGDRGTRIPRGGSYKWTNFLSGSYCPISSTNSSSPTAENVYSGGRIQLYIK